ncbi:hypothetical protein NL676_006063 [Syzygium grande]|nr:hypothetical protein NL676_006063 [Syzygium grande]
MRRPRPATLRPASTRARNPPSRRDLQPATLVLHPAPATSIQGRPTPAHLHPVVLECCGVYMLTVILRARSPSSDRKTGRRIGGGREAGGLYLLDPEIIAATATVQKKPLGLYTWSSPGLESRLFTSGRLTTISGTSF